MSCGQLSQQEQVSAGAAENAPVCSFRGVLFFLSFSSFRDDLSV